MKTVLVSPATHRTNPMRTLVMLLEHVPREARTDPVTGPGFADLVEIVHAARPVVGKARPPVNDNNR